MDLLGLLTTVVELPEAPYAVGEGLTAGEVNVVGVTWQDEGRDEEVAVYLRTGTNGGWGAWESYEVEPSHEPGARSGTDPIVLLGAGIDVQVAASYGDAAPTDVTLSVVDPLRAPADSAADLDVTGTAGGLARPMSASVTSSPVIYSRNDWGADPALLDWTPEHGRVGGVVVHHTAGTNGYSASQVPAILRGIYYYHSVTRAWGDIGYNLLADSYGRLWEGRAGGLSQPIIGAHATGWNSNTFGISVLGDFTQTALPEAAMNALSHAIAWKFLLHGVNPDGTMAVNGATRATIVGHRDVGNTVCPGDRIYSRIGELRSNVKSIIASGIYTSSSTPTPTPSPSPSVPQDVVGATPAPVAAPFPVNPTAASGLQGYDPNRLMSDSVMYNPSTMNTASVQSFLDTRGSSCVQGSDGSSCLKNATFSTPNRAATAYCSQPYQGQANESVAAIIAKSAQACGVNPQVLLTILQKEQGLVTTTNPAQRMYDAATGFRCTDTAPCEPAYAGFVNQVYSAASRLQEYRLAPARFNYSVGNTYNVQFNPDATCGTATVTMQTAATAALYNYTPYVANQASLNAVSGTGDACSAYGNRNFYRNFNLWFGSPNPADGGAVVSTSGAIGQYWLSIGGSSSSIGGPVSNESCGLTGGGCKQVFQRGEIYWSPTTGAWMIWSGGALAGLWRANGAEAGLLGYPTSSEDCSLVNGGCRQTFQKGEIYWTAATGARFVWTGGAIAGRWRASGGEGGLLGYPTSSELCTLKGDGCYQTFQNGSIYWAPGAGAHFVWTGGAIAGRWRSTGAEDGLLGYPTSSELCTLKGDGCYQTFQNGSIYWSPSTGAHFVWTGGAIAGRWRSTGAEEGLLGYPTSSEVCGLIDGACKQTFQNGAIYWSPTSGANLVFTKGGIGAAWTAAGAERSPLGYPTTSETCDSSGNSCSQSFQQGRITWTAGVGVRTSYS